MKKSRGVQMPEILFTEGFLNDIAQVLLASKRKEIMDAISLLSDMPEIGSSIVPQSIRRKYGKTVRKLVVAPFDVVYEYHAERNEVHILALIHQRMAQ